jgi:UDP-N-acetylglucosamine 4,6-dehydratase
MHGVDCVVHAAALKQVPVCEYNPFEAIATNVTGGQNVIEAALDVGVKNVLAISTDKAVNPINLYGATKLCAEKLFIQANTYAPGTNAKFSCVRYGNVVGSRGSVIPLFLQQREQGVITVTDPNMTRFWITLEQGVRFVLRSLEQMRGGEIFVPKIPSMRLLDLARAIAPGCEMKTIGIRTGEKIHEVLVSEDEAPNALEFDDMFLLQPTHPWWTVDLNLGGRPVSKGFVYSSDNNTQWLNADQLRALAETPA